MVSIMFFMFFIVAIIGGMIVSIWGMSSSRRSMSGISFWMSSVMVSMPSRVSKIDRIDQHIGML
nr:hypothetical protein CPGR_01058 [Mycolicibacterium fortuitum subsp. fortuitum DSM 46621 = ATCC 6841 = JCM 6387]